MLRPRSPKWITHFFLLQFSADCDRGTLDLRFALVMCFKFVHGLLFSEIKKLAVRKIFLHIWQSFHGFKTLFLFLTSYFTYVGIWILSQYFHLHVDIGEARMHLPKRLYLSSFLIFHYLQKRTFTSYRSILQKRKTIPAPNILSSSTREITSLENILKKTK